MALLYSDLLLDESTNQPDPDHLRQLLVEETRIDFTESTALRPNPGLTQRMLRAVFSEPGERGSVATSVRLPSNLHEAASQMVADGWAASMTELVTSGLRTQLGLYASWALDDEALDDVHAALEEHYQPYPEARPSLAMICHAAAELADHPAADHPDLITAAIDDLGDGAYVEDILAWVRGALSGVWEEGGTS